MGLYETNGGNHVALHVAGIVLIVWRALQTWGMGIRDAGLGLPCRSEFDLAHRRAACHANLWQIS